MLKNRVDVKIKQDKKRNEKIIMDEMTIKPIAYIRTDFPEKFGIPRQSGIVPELKGRIVFEPEYRDPNALREVEKYTHIWIIWGFSANRSKESWEPTVRPPRLGGNTRVGVFATRSPFRPNPIGLSVVKIERITEEDGNGPVIYVLGADMVDNTPIYDIKPYIPYADSIPDAKGGFTDSTEYKTLDVKWETANEIPDEIKVSLTKILSNDPRPHYQNDPDRIYGMSYAGYEVKFKVDGNTVFVLDII